MLRRLPLAALMLTLGACTAVGGGSDEPVSTEPPEVGACRMLAPEDIQRTSNDTAPVDCAEKHTAETFAVGEFPAAVAGDDLDDPALGAYVFPRCRRSSAGSSAATRAS